MKIIPYVMALVLTTSAFAAPKEKPTLATSRYDRASARKPTAQEAARLGPKATQFRYDERLIRAAKSVESRVQKKSARPRNDQAANTKSPRVERAGRVFGWKQSIVTTTFWIGEKPTKRNRTPNHASSWDPRWAKNNGGTDSPDRAQRKNYRPARFVPGQNPFYVALPYNDVTRGRHKPEAARVIPWFKEAYRGPGKSVLKGRWVAIRRDGRVAYAQWEDCGPFRTDHHSYVFGKERPKPNLNKGAGLDVSPAVRDFLGMADTDVTDWKFVELRDVPSGPWAQFGRNNPLAMNRRVASSGGAE